MSQNRELPDAGDLIVIPSALSYDRYWLCRVVKVRPSIWLIEKYERAFLARKASWDHPQRAKVTQWYAVPDGADPQWVAEALYEAAEQLFESEKQLRKSYHARVKALVEGSGK